MSNLTLLYFRQFLHTIFGRPCVKRFALCYRTVVCLSVLSVLSCLVLSVCNVGVGLLWPNGWMDQDETGYGGRPYPGPHCVRWGPSSPSPKGHSPQFRPMSIVAKRSPISATADHLFQFCNIRPLQPHPRVIAVR